MRLPGSVHVHSIRPDKAGIELCLNVRWPDHDCSGTFVVTKGDF